jgi:hypothetical protein
MKNNSLTVAIARQLAEVSDELAATGIVSVLVRLESLNSIGTNRSQQLLCVFP